MKDQVILKLTQIYYSLDFKYSPTNLQKKKLMQQAKYMFLNIKLM